MACVSRRTAASRSSCANPAGPLARTWKGRSQKAPPLLRCRAGKAFDARPAAAFSSSLAWSREEDPALRILFALLALAGCAPSAPPREPGLAGYLHIFQAARDARHACAGLTPDCPGPIQDDLARAEARTPPELLLPPQRAAPERRLAEAALQAAHADCRARGIRPGSARWDSCRMDRGIERLNEVAGLR
jgi:hypothetical protein